ncbi:MAG: molybdopterin molybdotransferase MoeA [Epsilonproteobacteria bacterium]|nr:molybdopterin molybdenumtransferase MoeA [Campylobacterota bacterium]NPA57148.1 molybdopterin molybdotransferase MoeA [Campylobacterota bacterium]
MISFQESMEILEKLEVPLMGVERRFLHESLGYTLAQDIVADYNSPEAPTAAMDGYAIRAVDQERGRLQIVSQTPAGSRVERALGEGEAIKTFTGSLMPPEADTLIPIENVRVDGDSILIERPVERGFSVRPVGENFSKGDILIRRGSRIGFGEIGVMASLNIVMPKVYQKPKVAILATGSEVLELGERQDHWGQIRSSNNSTLEAIVRLHGGEPVQLGVVKDDRDTITSALLEALKSSHIVVTTGGVSVGDYDFVKDVVQGRLGAKVAFKGVVIKPGQHVMVAQLGDQFIISLPGFAYSSTITALIYLLPLIYRMRGSRYRPKMVYGTLREPFKKLSRKREFTPCHLTIEDGEIFVDFRGNRKGSSAIMTNMIGEERGLVVTDPDEGDKEVGERVLVWLIHYI